MPDSPPVRVSGPHHTPHTRSANPAAEPLVAALAALAALAIQGDTSWPQRTGQVDTYRDALSDWFVDDSTREFRFTELTRPDAAAGMGITWFQETGVRLLNPHSDGIPGTEYYRYDEVTGQYLYAAGKDSSDWATDEARRYSEPAHDDAYGMRSAS
ncbi:hypothetical protein AB0M36_12940 [Actinoplanes sp. NPDC051346]|uniref:hypothetical protein n=1 Tax=Actinoplanes sp. NPDC051346 TaxID=3155048 RepID=UPI00341C0649